MKVLWFTNNAVSLNPNALSGNWMQCLEENLSLSNDIQLFIATRARAVRPGRTVVGKTIYYSIPDHRTMIKKRLDVFLDREPHEYYLQNYLKIINEVRPDVIQVFGTEMDYGLICENTKVPVVVHIQGILHPCLYQLLRFKFSNIQLYRAQSFLELIRGSTYKNGIRIFKRRTLNEARILKSCSNVIGRTEWDKRTISILAPKAQYFHCDEILRQEFFERTWQLNTNDIINIVSVISTPAYKGHDNIISTCLVLKRAGVKFKWHVIGLNKTYFIYKLFYKMQESALSGLTQFHGELAPAAMIEVLLNSNVYVHPSHIENSSNALCEAMALGMPVIAIDAGGNASMIKDRVEGMIVPDNDPYSLAGMIKLVIENTVLANELGRNAKRRAFDRHDPEKIVCRLKAIYTELSKPENPPALPEWT